MQRKSKMQLKILKTEKDYDKALNRIDELMELNPKLGTEKYCVSMNMLSMIGKIGVASRAKPVRLTLNVSPGRASSTKKGTR